MYLKRFMLVLIILILFSGVVSSEEGKSSSKQLKLSVDLIMRNPKWIGSSPGNPYWSEDGKKIYFMWNPEGAESDSLYVATVAGGKPRKVTAAEQKKQPSRFGVYNRKRSEKVYAKEGDIFLLNLKNMQEFQITQTTETEGNPRFSQDEKKVIFSKKNNLYLWYKDNGKMVQLTDFRKGKKRPEEKGPRSPQEKWLKQEELKLIRVLKERHEKAELAKKRRSKEVRNKPKTIYLGDKRVQNIQLSPDEAVVTFLLSQSPKGNKRTIVPNYVTETGFTTDIPGRTKVGAKQSSYQMGIYNIKKDTVIYISTAEIPGINDKPDFLRDYPKENAVKEGKKQIEEMQKKRREKGRSVYFQGPYWSGDGRYAVIVAFSQDNKDRWILALEPQTGKMRNLDRQHDEAWIGGPGVRGWWRSQNVGWLPDNHRFWFQSEATGYSHLYTVDVVTGEKKQLTNGNFEVFNPQISRDKKQWYFTSSEVHPGERHFYRMPLNGGKRTQITSLTGSNQVVLSPDEKMLAVRYSYSNKPWKLYIMPNKPGAKPLQTISYLTDEFKSYPWRDPEIIRFKARDGAGVYARLYHPENPQSQGPAVVFVHGAGYLQNAHKWWSSYFREYMFHNLLVDHGYTVLDMDYRGSAGYGRDWRTAIYRHMGGKDLTDQVDGVKYLTEKYDVAPNRVGIYGGSYGGFITLMAMFTTPDVFACGAALRPVTDWAHYNHGYTANILNIPYLDSLAYVRSSPIYFAEGLKGALLICHGMVDTNVHFQDVVRLTQRLIELGKENWQVAFYPVESHGFREPSSWTDEYKRIFKLFEENLK